MDRPETLCLDPAIIGKSKSLFKRLLENGFNIQILVSAQRMTLYFLDILFITCTLIAYPPKPGVPAK